MSINLSNPPTSLSTRALEPRPELLTTDYAQRLTTDLHAAKDRAYVSTFILGHHWPTRDHNTQNPLAALRMAATRGVKAALLLSHYDNPITPRNPPSGELLLLRKYGVRIAFGAKDQVSHAKFVIIDADICYVGSHNFTFASMTRNFEVTVRYQSADLANQLLQLWNRQARTHVPIPHSVLEPDD